MKQFYAVVKSKKALTVLLGTDHWKSDGGGGWGKNQKKIHARGNAKKKNSCKEEGKEKKFMQKEGPIVTFSESLSFC